jgi:hypothetical protein
MKKLLLVFTLLFFSLSLMNAQNWNWKKIIPAAGRSYPVHPVTDHAGNLYTSLQNDSSQNTCVIKFDPNGNELWKKYFDHGISITSLAAVGGRFFVTGDFFGAVQVDNILLKSRGGLDILLACFNSEGNVLWIKSMGGKAEDYAQAICADALNNIYLTGSYSDTAEFSNGSLICQGRAMFMAKFDADGNKLLLKSAGVTDNSSHSSGDRVQTDETGNIYVLGKFYEMALDSFHLTSSHSDYGSTFLCKLDSNGAVKWLNEVAVGTERLDNFIAESGNIYAIGRDGWTDGSWIVNKKINLSGKITLTKKWGFSGDGHSLGISDFTCDHNAFWTIGYESKTNSSTGITDRSLLLVKLDFNSNILKYVNLPADNYVASPGICYNPGGGFFTCGTVDGKLKFGNDSLFTQGPQAFVAKFDGVNVSTSVASVNSNGTINVFPNPSEGVFTIQIENTFSPAKIIVRDLAGKCLYEEDCAGAANQQLNLSAQPKGIYFVEVLSGGERFLRKVSVD